MTRALIAAALAATAVSLVACDREVTCAEGETSCDGACTMTSIDPRHCGACGVACGPYQECNTGACECGPDTALCGDACADLSSSPSHCGDCATACDQGLVCSAGSCAAACAEGLTDCGRACVDLSSDRWSCGSCGSACLRGESCRSGQCRPDLYVACFATDDVRPANAALRAGFPRRAGDGPIALALAADRLFSANSISHSLSSFALDLWDEHEILLAGSDFEGLAEHGGVLFVSNAGTETLIAYDPAAGRVADEVVLGDLSGVNPRGAAFVGDIAWVALYGTNPSSGGQEVVAVDFSGLAACSTPPCGSVGRRIDLRSAAGPDGLPFPSAVAALGTKVYATLSNLKLGSGGYYTDPAGNGKLAVVDTAAGDALSIVDLGASCTNPGALAAHGNVLWVSCGGCPWAPVPVPGALVPVDLSQAPPAVGTAVSLSGVSVSGPGKLAFCGGTGYVTDQWSGTVVRFDPAGILPLAAGEVCPASAAGWAWAADVACAP